nr:hypothetical protein Iba_chr15aCG8070 [Ipomoea batatas]
MPHCPQAKASAQTIAALSEHVEPADTIIDGDFQPKICYHPRQGEAPDRISESQVAASPRSPTARMERETGGGNSQVEGEQKTEQKMVMVNKVLKMRI